MTNRKFYIAFFILTSLVILTLVIFTIIVSAPLLQKTTGGDVAQEITLDKPLFNPLNPKLGPDNAKLKIVKFCDFLCPICKKTSENIIKLVEDYPKDTQIIWKNFPNIELHPTSAITAIAAQCANEQGFFWEYHNLIFDNQKNLVGDHIGPLLLNFADDLKLDKISFAKCLASQDTFTLIGQDFEEGRALGIDGTPYLFINDVVKISGGVEYDELEEYLR